LGADGLGPCLQRRVHRTRTGHVHIGKLLRACAGEVCRCCRTFRDPVARMHRHLVIGGRKLRVHYGRITETVLLR
jgi:hypothetical protein